MDPSLFERALQREKSARRQAEQLLEEKSRDLYLAKERVEGQLSALKQRSTQIEFLHSFAVFEARNRELKKILQFFVDEVCKMSGWPVGNVYLASSEDPELLVPSGIWHIRSGEAFDKFRTVTDQTTFRPGIGLPGRILSSGKPAWIEDVHKDDNFPRAKSAMDVEVRGAFGVPIKIYGRVLAVAEFFSRGSMAEDQQMLELVETGAIQLGSALERRKAEEDLQTNYQRLAEAHRKLREAQGQLVQSEKMASLGMIAAGVAHEINNPVGFVMSNLGTLGEYVATFTKLLEEYDRLVNSLSEDMSAEAREALRRIEEIRIREDLAFIREDVGKLLGESREGAERVREIVQGLRSFARVDDAGLKEADLNEGIEATLKIVGNELKYHCEVQKRLAPLPPLRCFPGQLNQVFMNLLINAAQAIPQQGVVTIESAVEDDEIVIRFSDTGMGIPKENMAKLFDPFFTTKELGKGTGLGLAISYGIVQRHNGSIEVESEPGKGSTFTIRLPLEGVPEGKEAEWVHG